MMNKKNMKKIAAAALTAITLTAPLSAEAHFLSSRQEKAIGNQAVADFQTRKNEKEEAGFDVIDPGDLSSVVDAATVSAIFAS